MVGVESLRLFHSIKVAESESYWFKIL